jgi:microcystin-dependent protein
MIKNQRLVTVKLSVPVGTVQPFAGDIGDQDILSQLAKEGWLPCTGLLLKKTDYPDLYNVILYTFGGVGETFNLPDACGLFIRGARKATESTPGGVVGTVQKCLTRPPVAQPFTTGESGEHDHTLPHLPKDKYVTYYTAGNKTAEWNNDDTKTREAGAHTHVISGGGDKETRPLNVYVDFIIKAGLPSV